jgi:hypothetical protein
MKAQAARQQDVCVQHYTKETGHLESLDDGPVDAAELGK